MKSIVRGFVKTELEQNSFYFEGTYLNLAGFIFDNEDPKKELTVETIFGKKVLFVNRTTGFIEGDKAVVEQVNDCLHKMRSGEQKSKVQYLDLNDMNNRDEFDSKDMIEKEFVRLYDGR